MDNMLRDLERRLAQDSTDEALILQWLRCKQRMGETVVKNFFKVKVGNLFLSTSGGGVSFTKVGTQFKTREGAVKALVKYKDEHPRHSAYTRRNTNYPNPQGASLVSFQVYTVVSSEEEVDAAEELRKIKLADIRAQKLELEKQERKLLNG
jgi:hypothetical protein